MTKQLLLLLALTGALLAQTLEGTWQGTLTPPNRKDGIRLSFKIDKNGNTYQGTFYNLANGREFNLGAITLQRNALKIAVPENGMNYEGKIEADGNSITGNLTPPSASETPSSPSPSNEQEEVPGPTKV